MTGREPNREPTELNRAGRRWTLMDNFRSSSSMCVLAGGRLDLLDTGAVWGATSSVVQSLVGVAGMTRRHLRRRGLAFRRLRRLGRPLSLYPAPVVDVNRTSDE